MARRLPLEGGGPLKLLARYLWEAKKPQNRIKQKNQKQKGSRNCSLITSSWMSDHIALSLDILAHPHSGGGKSSLLYCWQDW